MPLQFDRQFTESVDFGVDYTAGNLFKFSIVYVGGSLGWEVVCQDYTGGDFDLYYETRATGTKLVDDNGTSVFFENWNLLGNWYNGFTNPISCFGTEVYKNNQWTSWASGEIVITNLSGTTWPNNGKITGSLLGYQTAQWHLELFPLAQ
jgi:hypothetical protein